MKISILSFLPQRTNQQRNRRQGKWKMSTPSWQNVGKCALCSKKNWKTLSSSYVDFIGIFLFCGTKILEIVFWVGRGGIDTLRCARCHRHIYGKRKVFFSFFFFALFMTILKYILGEGGFCMRFLNLYFRGVLMYTTLCDVAGRVYGEIVCGTSFQSANKRRKCLFVRFISIYSVRYNLPFSKKNLRRPISHIHKRENSFSFILYRGGGKAPSSSLSHKNSSSNSLHFRKTILSPPLLLHNTTLGQNIWMCLLLLLFFRGES